jgi:hypothetical protein
MPISNLQNLSVPTSEGATNGVLLMPKLKYRFRLILNGFGVEGTRELTRQVVDITRPKVGFEEIELPVYNSRVYLAGRYTLEAININLRDDASGEVQKLVGQQIQKQFDFAEQASARSGIDYKFTTTIEVLDGGNASLTPNVLETFNLYGCFLTNADYGDMNYGTNEPVQVALTVRYDNLEQFAAGQQNTSLAGGIGALVRQAQGSSNATTGSAAA